MRLFLAVSGLCIFVGGIIAWERFAGPGPIDCIKIGGAIAIAGKCGYSLP